MGENFKFQISNFKKSAAAEPGLREGEAEDIRRVVMRALAEHAGAGNPITGRQLAMRLGMRDDRKVRMVIQQLIEEGQPIAASTSEPAGYYVLASRAEAEEYMAVLRSRAQMIFRRMGSIGRTVERVFGVPFQPGLFKDEG